MKREPTPVFGHAPAKQVRSRFTSSRFTLAYCSLALLLFAFLSFSAVSTKSATFDESSHVLSSCVALRHGDFRVEVDHPPLWKYLAALPTLLGPPAHDNVDTPAFRRIPSELESVWAWCVPTLYHTPGNDPDRILSRSRFMMLLLGLALGAVTALFAYRAAGPLAACVAVTLFSLDPNFLAHAAIVKDDVAITLVFTALACALWRAGQSLTWPRALAVAALCGCAVTTKLTGILVAPIVLLALATRALLPTPWPVPRRTLATRAHRLLAALSLCLACALVAYGSVWAVYRFRFDPAPDPSVHIDTRAILLRTAINEARARHAAAATPESRHPSITRDDIAAWRPTPGVNAALFALDHHLLPEPYVNGFLYTYASSRYRLGYVLGHIYGGGKWYYFPLVLLVKTPLATLATLLLAALSPLFLRRSPNPQSATRNPQSLWLLTCLALPVLILGASLASAGLNLGIRHLLPIFPPLFIAAAVAVSRLYSAHPKFLKPLLAFLLLALAAESLLAYPNYIPFFNAAAGGYRGGYHILSDSNLDWGQDLPLLAAWQRQHPDRPLHLAYFGTADPDHYGIRYSPLPGGFPFEPVPGPLPSTGVLAVSATILQGAWSNADLYAPLRNRRPTTILGGSIYLFDLDAP